MELKDFKGKTLQQIEDALDDHITAIALKDEGMWGSVLGSAYREQGKTVCAIYVASLLYSMQNPLMQQFAEAFQLVDDAAKILTEKKRDPDLIGSLKNSVHNMEGWLCYSSTYFEKDHKVRMKKWPIVMKELSPAQLIALAVSLCYYAGMQGANKDTQSILRTTEVIGWSCAARHMQEVMDACTKVQKKKAKRNERKRE